MFIFDMSSLLGLVIVLIFVASAFLFARVEKLMHDIRKGRK